MKIEAFAAFHKVPVRKVRYYIDEGLIHPEKKDGALILDDSCGDELKTILKLKQSGFVIREIKEWQELAALKEVQAVKKRRREILDEVLTRLEKEKSALEESLRGIAQHLGGFRDMGRQPVSGSSLGMLEYIVCPWCKKPLVYHDVWIADQQILGGRAACGCGYEILIQDGIFVVQTPDPGLPPVSPLDFHRETYNRMPPEEVSEIHINFNWVKKQLEHIGVAGKVIFENSVDVIGFLSTGIAQMSPDARYIIADSSFQVLEDVKHRIEALDIRRDILYIVSPNLLYPIKDQCVDILIDYYTTEVLQRLNIPTLFQGMKRYMKTGSHLLGVFTYVKKGTRTLKKNAEVYPQSYKGRYDLRALQNNLHKSGIHIETEIIRNIPSSVKGLDTYQEGDILGEYCYWGTVEQTNGQH